MRRPGSTTISYPVRPRTSRPRWPADRRRATRPTCTHRARRFTRWSRASRRSASPTTFPHPLDRVARAPDPAAAEAGPLDPVGDAHPGPSKGRRWPGVRDQLDHRRHVQPRRPRIRRADGAVPVWALTTPRAPRLAPGPYARSSFAHRPPPRAMPILSPRAPRRRVRRPGGGVPGTPDAGDVSGVGKPCRRRADLDHGAVNGSLNTLVGPLRAAVLTADGESSTDGPRRLAGHVGRTTRLGLRRA